MVKMVKNNVNNIKRFIFVIISIAILFFTLIEVNSFDLNQNVTVIIGPYFNLTQKVNGTIAEVINLTIDPENLNFGTLYPGDTKTINVTLNNSKSNVNVTIDSISLINGGAIFDNLLFNGNNRSNFIPVYISAWNMENMIVTLKVPDKIPAGPQNDVIVYTVTGPVP